MLASKPPAQWHVHNSNTFCFPHRLDEEIVTRKEIEEDLNAARKDCDDATLSRMDLDSRIKALQEEIEFLNKVHREVCNNHKTSLCKLIKWSLKHVVVCKMM